MMQTMVPGPDGRNHLQTPVAHARSTDPQTSHDAAATVAHITELKLKILQAYQARGPMRDDELVAYLRDSASGPRLAATEQSIRSRRAELAGDDSMVEALRDRAGELVKTEMPSGRSGVVWKAR